jgi:hypothetical protein
MKLHASGNGMAGDGSVYPLSAEAHGQMVQDLARLHDSRVLLVERLERVVVALALTLDAETAAAERLAHLEHRAGVRRIADRSTDECSLRAQRYRDVIRVLASISDEAALDCSEPMR